ncbi:ENTH/VHS [Artemisia annua]|uniref:ENTH/VHS n=1 Tax=Artemisia annua TaxID=35608 RepID=A0A2U1KMG9_ARTAN|nr:ENTH/VHS [Artemisia annua]
MWSMMFEESAAGSSLQVDLFGDSLIGDLLDTPTPVPTQDSNRNSKSKEVDLFADAAFVSAPTSVAVPVSQTKVDLFASPPAAAAASSPAVDFFAAPEQVVAPETKPAESNIQSVDPFAAVPMNNFDNSDFFGSFSAHTGSASSAEPTTQSFMDSGNSSNNQIHKTSVASSKKDGFQEAKKVDLSDVGIVGGLSAGTEEKDKGLPNSLYMGRAMGTGSGLGKSTGYSSLSFQK